MSLTTDILLACAAGLTLAWLVAAQRRLVARAARRFVSLPRVEQMLAVLAVCVLTVCAQKDGSNVVFNAEIEEAQRRGEEVSAQSGSGLQTASTKEETTSFEAVGRPLPLSEDASVASNTSMLRAKSSLTTNDVARGFALTRVGTNEVFDFSAPEGANYATNWMLHGGATARTRLRFDDWTFPFGDGCLTNLTAFMFGVIAPDLYNEEMRIAPLQASLGFVAGTSSFWSLLTPSNSLIITWQNVLLHRLPENPVSFQVEFFANGDFTYRYDFSQLPSDAVLTNAYVIAAPGIGEPFVLSRDEPLEGECLSPTLDRNLTSLTFRRLDADDQPGADRDGDGLTTEEELFVYGTDLGLADTSGDGISDGEAVSQGLDPLARNATDTDILARVAASATNAAFASATTIAEGSLAAWQLFDGFAADVATGSTNVIWERTFAVNRTSAWKQFFVSSEKDAAGAWMLEGLRLEWEASDGSSGSLARSPVGDSFRIPLSTNEVSTITLRLRATGAASVRSVPLYLLSYEPTFQVAGAQKITGESGATYYVLTRGADAALQITADESRRPHRAAIGDDERDWSSVEAMGEDFSLADDGVSASVSVPRPGIYSLPTDKALAQSAAPRRAVRRAVAKNGMNGNGSGGGIVVLDPSVWWACSGHGCWHDGLSYDWSENVYVEEKDYPLDTKCLRKKWYHLWGGGWLTTNCTLWVNSGAGENGVVTTEVDADNVGHVFVDGVAVWKRTTPHIYDDMWGCGGSETLEDECDDCDSDCSSGNCDSLEGSSLGSLRFRIPLGSPGKGLVAGFAWFASEGPVAISRSLFQVKAHPSATISDTTASGVRHIVCSDAQGRDLAIEGMANGVRVTIRTASDQTLEHTWEITNVDGDSSRVRLKKISRRDNVMSDETYAYADGTWTRTDNIAATTTQLETWDELASGGTKVETRTTTDATGQTLARVTTEQTRIGSCDNAVLRETRREEWTGPQTRVTEATYWDDPQTQRHGLLKLLTSNARAWEYHDYDGDGRETLRVTQRNGAAVPAAFPLVVSNELQNAQGLSDASVTVFDYEPLAGDSDHADDFGKARMETEFVVRDGAATVVGKKWYRYTRLTTQGYDAIKCETWRAASANAAFGDAANAYSYEITFADTGDGTPRLMRGAVAEAVDEDGVKTINAYSMNGNVLVCETRKFYGSGDSSFPTYETTETEATEGTLLRRTTRLTSNGAIIADERSTYDEQRRLRSTTYLDGTSLTNAYSCCRLLWSIDRERRKTLRSAKTGTDHLYYANEDIWLADVSTNGAYRVTQHFFDALGRETNTVVSVGSTPGEATSLTWRSPFAASGASSADPGSASLATLSSFASFSSTRYPYGGSDYSISTDARGAETVRRIDLIANGEETCEAIFTNGIEVSRTKSRSIFGGATSTHREWGMPVGQTAACENWTEQTRIFDYDASGRRVDYAITTSSDYGIVTNSVSIYDFLGRVVSTATSLGTTAYEYDGTTSRIAQSVFTAGDVRRVTTYLYNEQGELVGATTDGVTSRSDVVYETDASNLAWRVTTDSVVGATTNDWTITREQLTALTNDLRSCTMTETKRGVKTCTTKFCDAMSGITTETSTASNAPTTVSHSRFGIEVEREADNVTRFFSIDPFGRSVREERTVGASASRQFVSSHDYKANGNLLSVSVFTNGSDVATTRYEYDAFGQRVLMTDALGQETRTDYDAVGNVVAESGATYPIRRAYDTAGRCTLLATTRDGETWDETRWVYDAATEVCTAKTYADGLQVTYTYTPDGLLSRTTYASGRWIENVYDSRRQVIGRISGDGSDDAVFERDEFGRLVASSNAAVSILLTLSDVGLATNEIWTATDSPFALNRDYDDQSRIMRLAAKGSDYEQNFYYAEDGRIETVSNGDAVVTYAYASDRQDAGYTIRLSNGNCFTRTVERDACRRELVTSVTNSFNGVMVDALAYSHDVLNRPISRNNDSFSYNLRGEVASAQIAGFVESHGYDDIGNSTFAATVSATNNYSVNGLNQYTSILCDSAALRETNTPTYDADGNLTALSPFSYAYDSESRFVSVSSNDTPLATYAYDTQGRRVRKTTPGATTTFFHDDWNLIEERIAYTNGTSSIIHYYWGKDLSGSLQGAGGIGGLLYLTIDGAIYIPLCDANGNITKYLDANANVVASYVYDAFGNTLTQSGSLADNFAFRFSAKYHDAESGLYYYAKRFYSPSLRRWLTRDPMEERGGVNLYAFCANSPMVNFDSDGCAYFAVRKLSASPFELDEKSVRKAIGSYADRKNMQILHEQLFFEDGKSPENIGYASGGFFYESDNKRYIKTDSGYNDCIMRKAVNQVSTPLYSLVGRLFRGYTDKFNCQDYCERLRAKYNDLENDPVVKKQCCEQKKK